MRKYITMYETILLAIAIAASLYGYVSYGRDIHRRTLRPRTTTWLIWGVLGTVVAIIQLRHGAGLGSVGAILGAISGYVLAGMAWYYGHRRIHEADIISVLLTFAALIAWAVYGDTLTVVLASAIYLIGFLPTIIRASKAPRNEKMTPFMMAVIKYGISIILLGSITLETALYPTVLLLANAMFVLFLIHWRGKNLRS